jgi:hypothetical protein
VDTHQSDGGNDGRLEQSVVRAGRNQALHLRLELLSMRLIGILVFGVQRQIANALTDSDYSPEVGLSLKDAGHEIAGATGVYGY